MLFMWKPPSERIFGYPDISPCIDRFRAAPHMSTIPERWPSLELRDYCGASPLAPVILSGATARFVLDGPAVEISCALAIQLRGAEFRESVRRESAEEVH